MKLKQTHNWKNNQDGSGDSACLGPNQSFLDNLYNQWLTFLLRGYFPQAKTEMIDYRQITETPVWGIRPPVNKKTAAGMRRRRYMMMILVLSLYSATIPASMSIGRIYVTTRSEYSRFYQNPSTSVCKGVCLKTKGIAQSGFNLS